MKYMLAMIFISIILERIITLGPGVRSLPFLVRFLLWILCTRLAKNNKMPAFRRFVYRRCPPSSTSDQLICIVTGASCGIGAACAKELMRRGHRVIFAVRDVQKAKSYIEKISWRYDSSGRPLATVISLDLADLSSIRKFVAEFEKRETKLDRLVLNAGVNIHRCLTKDGFEMTIGVNHLGHMYLTYLLRNMLTKSARVVVVSSETHRISRKIMLDDMMYEKNYGAWASYAHKHGITVNSCHPGTPVESDVMRSNSLGHPLLTKIILPPIYWLWWRKADEGAQNLLYLALANECGISTGNYYENCIKESPSSAAMDNRVADQVWEYSCNVLKIDKDWIIKPDKGSCTKIANGKT